jgi:hypothetical protein
VSGLNYALDGDVGAVVSPIFPASVLRWGPLLKKYGGSIPLPYLFAWLQKESYGNPCSWTSLRESGIFQLMYPGNLNEGGTTEEKLRAACVGTTQKASRDLTASELEEQVRSGIQYVRHAMAYARKYVNWPESGTDFWKMVKMVHVAPARVKQYAPGASSWTEFRQRAAAGGNTPAHWLDNAEWVGSRGTGGGGPITTIVVIGLVTAGVLFLLHTRSRRS